MSVPFGSTCEGSGGTLNDLTGIKSIKPGQNHTLALTDNDTPADESDDLVVAWGLGTRGQLGDGIATHTLFPVRVVCGEMTGTSFCSSEGILQGVTAVAASGGEGGASGSSLALLTDGTLVSWGSNRFGQLGNGVSGQRVQSTPVRVLCGSVSGANCVDGYLAEVEAVAPGFESNYALLSDGTIASWGANFGGWLGDGTIGARATPGYVHCGDLAGAAFCSLTGHLQGVTTLSKAQTSLHFFALLADGTVAAWGDITQRGLLGDGTTVPRFTPVRVVCGEMTGTSFCSPEGYLQGVTALASGSFSSLALLSDGRVITWGPNFSGQLGNGTTADSLVPVLVPGLSGAVDIAAGFDHAHVVLVDGTMYAWGQNNRSQLAFPSSVSAIATSPVLTLLPLDAP